MNNSQKMYRAKMLFYSALAVTVVSFLGMEFVLPVALFLFVATGYYYGQVKGYSSIIGAALGFFGAIGLGVLLFLPDKNPLAPGPESTDSDSSAS